MIGQAERISQLSLYFNENMNYPEIPIFGITSGKGGTGKSFFTLNLAKALFENNLRVLVIDMDLNFSNLHILLNIFPDSSIKDYFQNNTSIEKIIQKEEFADFIFGESGSRNKITEIAIDLFFKNLSKIEKNYDLILVDTASGGSDLTLSILSKTTKQILIANPEPTSVMDSYVIIKLLIEKGIKSSKFIVINKSRKKEESRTAFENINKATKHFLKIENELLGFISYDEKIRKSSANQTLFFEKNNSCKTKTEIENISQEIHKYVQMANIKQK